MHQVDPYAKESGRQKLGLIIGGAVLVVALAIGFGLAVLSANRNNDGASALAQQSPEPIASLPAATNTPDPALPIEKPPEVKMPDDIYNWLEHLRRTDERLASETNSIGMDAGISRMSHLRDMYGKALDGNFEDYAPSSQSDNINAKTTQTFDDLAVYFDTLPPPTECIPIYNAYKVSLSETEANVNEISRIMDTAFSSAMQGGSTDQMVDDLKNIYSDHKDGIDEHRRQTDILVQQICDKYKTRKWFNIKSDPANPIMQGMVDMLMSSMGN